MLHLQVMETNELQSVESILSSPFNIDPLRDYSCNLGPDEIGCQKAGFCNKASLVLDVEDLLIIQLKIFAHEGHGTSYRDRKIFPAFQVDQNISVFDDFTLTGIIWHHGPPAQSGHYTAMVQHNERWCQISDESIDVYPIKFG